MRLSLRSAIFALALPFAAFPLAAESRGLEILASNGVPVGGFKASYALVIGETLYSAGWPKLPGVATDAELVAEALEKAGFSVTTRKDLGSEDLKRAYEDFINTYGLDEGNRLVFYYAGHGHTLKLAGGRDMGYIVPVDAPNPNLDATGFKKKAVPMQLFDTWAKGIEARHALFLFDSCFSGSIFNITRAVPDNISEKTAKPVRQFITSGSADEQVPDRSVFRDQFVAGIGGEADRNGDGYVTGAELGEFLDEKVVNYSKKSQHPQYGKIQDPALDKGDFVFAVPKAENPAPVVAASATVPSEPPASPTLNILRSYGSVTVSTMASGSLFLDGKAMGELTAGAKARLDSVESGERLLEMRYADGQKENFRALVSEGKLASVAFSHESPPPLAAVAAKPASSASASAKPNAYPPKVIRHKGTDSGLAAPEWLEPFLLDSLSTAQLPRYKGKYLIVTDKTGKTLSDAADLSSAKELIKGILIERIKTLLGATGASSTADSKLDSLMLDLATKVSGATYTDFFPEDSWWVEVQNYSAEGKPTDTYYRVVQLWSAPKAAMSRQLEKVVEAVADAKSISHDLQDAFMDLEKTMLEKF